MPQLSPKEGSFQGIEYFPARISDSEMRVITTDRLISAPPHLFYKVEVGKNS